MLYYTSLFLIIVLVSMVAIWMYRVVFGVSRAAYRSSVQGGRKVSKRAKARMKARRKARIKAGGSSTTSGVPDAWGWSGTTGLIHSDRDTHNPGSLRGHARAGENIFATAPNDTIAGKNAGWPYKEEKVEFVGKAYKVNRKAADDGDLDGDGKPWV